MVWVYLEEQDMIEIPLSPDSRWKVLFKNEKWQCGLYRPEFTSITEIKFLEKHSCPELFFLIGGNICLVLSKDGREVERKALQKNKLYIIVEWHNAYRPEGKEGIALVVECSDVKTEYAEIDGELKI